MARGEVTGRKLKATTTRSRRSLGPPRDKDPSAVEPVALAAEAPGDTKKANLPRGPPTHWFSIESFCAAHGISEAFYFELRKKGLAPVESRLGTRVFISHEAAARWRIEREAATVAAE
jgi:hypothetical protein